MSNTFLRSLFPTMGRRPDDPRSVLQIDPLQLELDRLSGISAAAPPAVSSASAASADRPAAAPYLSTDQLPVRHRILALRKPEAFVDHKLRAMAIAFDSNCAASGVIVETMEFSLFCPYSGSRMVLPVRSAQCQHIQCCDLDSWVTMFSKQKTLRDPVAPCPVCDRRVSLTTLQVDEWVAVVLAALPRSKLVVLSHDGSFTSGDVERAMKRQREEEVIVDSQVEPQGSTSWTPARHREMLLDDSSDDMALKRRSSGSIVKLEFDANDKGATKAGVVVGTLAQDGNSSAIPVGLTTALLTHCEEQDDGVDANDRPMAQGRDSAGEETKLLQSFLNRSSYRFVPEGRRRTMPSSGWRHWTMYCNACRIPVRPAVSLDAVHDVVCDREDELFKCPRCAVQRARSEYPSFRVFFDSASAREIASIEVTEDETLLLKGCSGDMAQYLHRAGFSCANEPSVAAGTEDGDDIRSRTLWYTSRVLKRLEVDFLESLLERFAAGLDPVDSAAHVPLLFRFRWDRGGGKFGGSAQGAPLSQWNSPTPATAVNIGATAAPPVEPKRGLFRIQFGVRQTT